MLNPTQLAALATLLLATLSSATYQPRLSPDNRTLAQIYSAAQTESGTLQVAYGGDERTQADFLTQQFQTAFPKISINVTVDLSKYHSSRINRDYAQGNQSYADIACLQTLQDFDQWKAESRLLEYKPPSWDDIYTELKPADGAFLPIFGAAFGPFVYNSSLSNAPTSFGDILKPEWKSHLVLTWPNDDDAVLYQFSLIVDQYGFEWLSALGKQDVRWVRGTATPAEMLAQSSNNRLVSFTTFPLPGQAYIPPASDRYMSWFQSGAIFKSTRMPETAKLMLAFLTSTDYQTASVAAGFTPTLRSVSNGGPVATFNRTQTESVGFHQFMLQRDRVESFRLICEETFGTAQGISPLLDSID